MTANSIRTWVSRLTQPGRNIARGLRYHSQLRRAEAAGDFTYVSSPWQPPAPGWRVEVRWPGGAVQAEEAIDWCRRQSLVEVVAAGFGEDGQRHWQVNRQGLLESQPVAPAPWFLAPTPRALEKDIFDSLDPCHVESCLLILAAEGLDAVVLGTDAMAATFPAEPLVAARDVTAQPWRPFAVFSSAAYRYLPPTDAVIPTSLQGTSKVRRLRLTQRGSGQAPAEHEIHGLVKFIPPPDIAAETRGATTHTRYRRGPYFSRSPLGSRLVVKVRDASLLPRQAQPDKGPSVLVSSSFLARGGAEHTLYETLAHLRENIDLTFVTLAPHRPELGDRRSDFRQLKANIFSLGDWVHPAVMLGMLKALIQTFDADVLYNANGTTLFYEFAGELKAAYPNLRIIDHLYDHQVGYIDRYDSQLLRAVDACVAENRRIAEVLTQERGWPAHRVPVVWPCGRPAEAFPTPQEAPEVRWRVRRELGYGNHDLIFLTAARMHAQKRPTDLVNLAQRVRDLPSVHFLVVGGGSLENQVDAAIAASEGAQIRRLPFRTDIPELIVAADVGCLVSEYEGLPVFLLECLQAGRPFLGTDVGEMGAVLKTTGAGKVVANPGDLEALEKAVRQLADPRVRAPLAERARSAGREFDVGTCADRYAKVFFGNHSQPQDGDKECP